MNKKEIAKDTLFDVTISAAQSFVTNAGQALVEENGLALINEVVANTAIETGVNLIPMIGTAIQSYRWNTRMDRVEKLIKLLSTRLDAFIERTNSPIEDKEKYSALLEYSFDSVSSYTQEDKIKYLSNGLINIFNAEDMSYDIGHIYIHTLNNLTILDIAVIKLFNRNIYYFEEEETDNEFNSYVDILEKFKISENQYRGILSNLYNLGLIETKTDQSIESDLKALEKQVSIIETNITNLYKNLELIINPKNKRINLNKIKSNRLKLHYDNKYVVSKFGRDFYNYFLDNIV